MQAIASRSVLRSRLAKREREQLRPDALGGEDVLALDQSGASSSWIRRTISWPCLAVVAVVDLAHQPVVGSQPRDHGRALEHRIGAAAEVLRERNVDGDGIDAVNAHVRSAEVRLAKSGDPARDCPAAATTLKITSGWCLPSNDRSNGNVNGGDATLHAAFRWSGGSRFSSAIRPIRRPSVTMTPRTNVFAMSDATSGVGWICSGVMVSMSDTPSTSSPTT